MLLLSKGVWVTLAALGSAGAGTGVFAGYHQPPKWENPVRMAHEVIHSSRDFDQLTGQLVPIFSQVDGRLAVTVRVEHHFVALTDAVGNLPPLAGGTASGAGALAGALAPVPGLVTNVSGQVTQGTSEVSGATSTVNAVTAQLDQVQSDLSGLSSQLSGLTPTAQQINATLAEIDADTKALGTLGVGNLLATLSNLLSGLGPGGQG